MKGIILRWECNSCGNIITITKPFNDKQQRRLAIEEPKCVCKNATSFNLLNFAPCEWLLKQ